MKRWILRSLIFISFCSLVTLSILLARLVILSDISLTPVDSERLDEGVYLVTYADGNSVFVQNQNALASSALNRGVDFIFKYRRHHLSPDFLKKNAEILKDPAGAERWLWKSYVILEAMKRIPEGAYVAYLDSGFVLKKNIIPLLKQMNDKDIMVVAYDPIIYGNLGSHVQREALMLSGCDTETCRKGVHVWAGLSFYRNSPKSHAFIEKWLRLSENPKILSPQPGPLPEYPEFKYHHNDESTMSITAHQMQEDIFFLPEVETHKVLAWHHRHPKNGSMSLLSFMHYDTLRRLEKDFVNSSFMSWLRSWVAPKPLSEAPH